MNTCKVNKNSYKLKINEKKGVSKNNTLVIAHGYGRSGQFYDNIINKILEEKNKYSRAISFDFPGHGINKEGISFKKSQETVYSAIEYAKDEYDGNIVLWGHSFGAYISTFLADINSDISIDGMIKHLFLSSLPCTMNDYWYMKFWKYVKKSHEDLLDGEYFAILKRMGFLGEENGIIRCRELYIPNIQEYKKELLGMPGLEEVFKINIPTTIIRAKIDYVLNLLSYNSGEKCKYLGPNKTKYSNLDNKFSELETIILGFQHSMGIPQMNKHPHIYKEKIKKLVNIILSI